MYVAMHFAAAAQVLLRLKVREQRAEIGNQFTKPELALLTDL